MATSLNTMAWSTTAASNNTADTGLPTLADSMTPTQLDDTFRGMMAALKRHILDVGGAPAAVGGTANAITITTNQVISTGHQAAGFSIRFKAANTNTGATTVAVDGLTAVAVERMGGTALQAGDIVSGGIYDIAYNATNSGYTLMTGVNPANTALLASANAFTGTNTFSVAPRPSANDAAALGVSGTAWSDLFLATGAVINFNAGAETITHAANAITFAGFSSGINLSNNTNITGALDVTGALTLGTALAVAEGGTGSTSASAARDALGVAIGADVQAYSARLAEIAALAVTNSNIIVGNGSAWVAESGATARTSLGLGTGDSPQFTAVNIGAASDTTITRVSAGVIAVEGSTVLTGTINNSNWSGTDLSVANGGTGASTLTGLLQGNGTSAITGGATINNSDWSGTDLSVANGGTGASTLTGLLRGNGTSAITGSSTINNDDWSGTDLAVANGGTGASTAASAATNLGLGTGDSPTHAALTLSSANPFVTLTDTSTGSDARVSGNSSTGSLIFDADLNNEVASSQIIFNIDGAEVGNINAAGALSSGLTVNDGNWSGTDLAVGNGGTGASTAAGAATNLGLGTGDSPQFAGVNVGHASDTTITRLAAGRIGVEGDEIATIGAAKTWTAAQVFNAGGTLGNDSGDTVVIKGVTVNSAVSATWDAASLAAFADEILAAATETAVSDFLDKLNDTGAVTTGDRVLLRRAGTGVWGYAVADTGGNTINGS